MKGFDPTSLREGGDSELNKLVSIRIDGLEGYEDDAYTTSDMKNMLADPHARNMANSRTSVTQGIARDTSQKRVNAGNLKQRKDGAVHLNQSSKGKLSAARLDGKEVGGTSKGKSKKIYSNINVKTLDNDSETTKKRSFMRIDQLDSQISQTES